MSGPVKRPYRSPLRKAQAESTRLAILRAAGRLFAEHGYVPTSIDAIAEAAGVSRATVFNAVGGKATILKAAYDVALVGDDAPVALPDRPASLAVMARTDPAAFLDGYAGIMTDVHGRLAPIYEAVRGASSADPEAREVWEAINAERLGGARNVVAGVRARGGLREGVDLAAAADVVWALNDPGLYHLLVNRRGWTPAVFRAWLSEALRWQLMPAGGGDLPSEPRGTGPPGPQADWGRTPEPWDTVR
jgi:AcrR family transcriptional regulator